MTDLAGDVRDRILQRMMELLGKTPDLESAKMIRQLAGAAKTLNPTDQRYVTRDVTRDTGRYVTRNDDDPKRQQNRERQKRWRDKQRYVTRDSDSPPPTPKGGGVVGELSQAAERYANDWTGGGSDVFDNALDELERQHGARLSTTERIDLWDIALIKASQYANANSSEQTDG